MKIFYNERYTAAAESFDTTRKSAEVARSLIDFPVNGAKLVSPDSATFEELCLVHDPFYVESVIGGHQPLADSAGFSWDEGVWEMAAASTGGVIAAATEAMETQSISGSLSSGLHHARFEKGEGFCTFNGLALVAIKYALQGAKVLIIDLDAHCGGGTHEITRHNNSIWQLDIATSGFDDYMPTAKQKLHIVGRSMRYLDILEQNLQRLESEQFDLVLYNAGMDPYHRCHLGGFKGITKAVLRKREKMVFDWCRAHSTPAVFVLAGGYTGPRLNENELVKLHRLTVEAACRR